MAEAEAKRLSDYTVAGLFAAGSRFSDWSPSDAVDEYLRLHPEADREAIAEELRREIEAAGG
ncbi:hypothetical protein EKE94_03075 [Mesobaculum littorinae]|uniref:Uncharacterized protein n=1 Tax=Mesobaculum littorinae TaxID=2486419 RepID=A0A438AM03_9RHOB|nr:hypothetical protein [Mesobaculum littorinae]RVV99680.1 hypothetical protein EKE94_03075 [Mesobaculum littorinae]